MHDALKVALRAMWSSRILGSARIDATAASSVSATVICLSTTKCSLSSRPWRLDHGERRDLRLVGSGGGDLDGTWRDGGRGMGVDEEGCVGSWGENRVGASSSRRPGKCAGGGGV